MNLFQVIAISLVLLASSEVALSRCTAGGGGSGNTPAGEPSYGTALRAYARSNENCNGYILGPDEVYQDREKSFVGSSRSTDWDGTRYTEIEARIELAGFRQFARALIDGDGFGGTYSGSEGTLFDVLTFSSITPSLRIPGEACFEAISTGWGSLDLWSGEIGFGISGAETLKLKISSLAPLARCTTGNFVLKNTPGDTKFRIALSHYFILESRGTGSLSTRFRLTSLPPGVTCKSASGQFPGCDGSAPAASAPIPSKEGLSGVYGLGLYGLGGNICSASSEPNKSIGNPINFALGFKRQDETDYAGGVLSFGRVYRSDSTWTDHRMGQRWRHNFARTFSVTGTTAQVTDGTGATAVFKLVSGTWVPEPDVTSRLQSVAGGYLYTTADDTREFYNTAGQLVRINYRGSQALHLTYSGSSLVRVADEQGRALTLTYAGSLVSAVDTPAGTYRYGYDVNGNLISMTNPAGAVRRYHYEDARFVNAMTGITDERGVRFSTYAYDAQGRAVLSKHAGDVNSHQVAYNADGSITTTNPLGKRTTYQFQTIHGVRKITSVQGHQSTNCAAANKAYTYDSNGFLSSKTDWKGNVTSLTHDARGLLAAMTEAAGTAAARTTSYTYHPTFRVPTRITEPGRVTAYIYDVEGRITSRTVTDTATSQARTTTFSYHPTTVDGAGNPVLGKLHTVDGPRTDVADVTTYQYTANGDLFRVINALGHVTEIRTRDAAGRPVRIVDPNNVHAFINYDAQGRIVKYTEGYNTAPDRGATLYRYFPDGRPYSVTKANGVSVRYFYDQAGRVSRVLNSDSGIYYTRDPAGNPIETRRRKVASGSPVAHRMFEAYDELSRLLSTRNNHNRTSFAYDLNGNVIARSDAFDRATVYEHDALDRLRLVTNRLGGVATYGIDSLDNLVSVTNPRGNTTGYVRNAFGDVLSEISPERGTTAYQYDEAGNRIRRTDGRGVVTLFGYDALNRLVSVSYPADATQNVTLGYDGPVGCGFGKGRLCSVSSASSARSFVYSARGDVIKTTDARLGSTFTIGYAYDTARYLTGITLPSGRQISYSYNLNGELAAMSTGGINLAYGFSYLPFGPVASFTYGNGLSQVNGYDDAYRLTGRVIGSVLSDTYTYDAKNNVRTRNGVTFDYDWLDRLTGQGADIYRYDANANRTAHTVAGVRKTFSYGPASGRLLSQGGRPVAYDGAGNITSDGERSYVYDAEGRLKEVSIGTSVVGAYDYDGAHQRVRKTAAGVVTHYIYGLDGRLYGEYAADGAMLREYVYANGEPLAQVGAGEGVTYLHTDHLGTPRTASNGSGAAVWNGSGSAYGVGAPSGAVTVNLRMPGQYFDAESGLFYNWHRYYDPGIGRYLTSDPIGLEGGLNTYGYAEANPSRFSDPEGLVAENDDVDQRMQAAKDFRRTAKVAGWGIRRACNRLLGWPAGEICRWVNDKKAELKAWEIENGTVCDETYSSCVPVANPHAQDVHSSNPEPNSCPMKFDLEEDDAVYEDIRRMKPSNWN